MPSDGLSGDLTTLGSHRLLVVVLPRPVAAAEAYYTAVVHPAGIDRCRYFTLEYAVNPFTGESYTVLGEWADGNHLSYGPGPEPSLSAFLSVVVEHLAASGPEPEEPVSQPTPLEPTPLEPPPSTDRRGRRRLFGR